MKESTSIELPLSHNYGASEHSPVNNLEEDIFEEPQKEKPEDKESFVDDEDIQTINYFRLYSTSDVIDKLAIAAAFIGAVSNGALLPSFSLLFGEFTDAFGKGSGSDFIEVVKSLSLKFFCLGLGSFGAAYLDVAIWTWSGNRQTNRLNQRYLRAVLSQEIAFFDTSKTGTGGLLQGINQDSVDVQNAISEKVGQILKHSSTFITGMIIAFTKGWDMTLVMLGCVPFMMVTGGMMAKSMARTAQRQNAAYAQASMVAQQGIAQVRTIYSYVQEDRMIQEYEKSLDDPVKVGIHQAFITGLVMGGFQLVIYGTFAVALVYGAWRVEKGYYTGGQVMNVLVAVLLGGFAIGQGAPHLQHIAKGRVAGAHLFSVIDRRPAILINDEDGLELEEVRGELTLENVRFAYPARPEVLVFESFSMHVPAGKTVALVGSSGSGKSTVVGLVERFYDPLAGEVRLDGVDIRKLRLSWLRNNVGLVSQEPTLFATTVYENIAMGKAGSTREEIEAAAHAANAAVFIDRLPDGYQTQVGERGSQLSGGQKQRIAIARAILKNPKIMLLDEATSALDTASERLVQAALDRMVVGRTTVVVAHRLSTIRGADIISVLVNGKMVEQGAHNELMAKPNSAYAALVNLQVQHSAGGAGGQEVGKEIAAVDSLEELNRAAGPGVVEEEEAVAIDEESPAARTALTVDVVSAAEDKTVALGGQRATGEKAKEKSGGFLCWGKAKKIEAEGAGGESKDESLTVEEQEALEVAKVDVSFMRLAKLNKPEWKLGVLGFFASIAMGGLSPAFSFILASMIKIFYYPDVSKMRRESNFFAGMFGVVGASAFVCYAVQQFVFGSMGQQLARRVRQLLFQAYMRQEVGWFDRPSNNSGQLTALLSTDAAYVRGAVADVVGITIQNLATVAIGYFIAMVYDWRMALLVTGILPFMIFAESVEVKYSMGFSSGADKFNASSNQAASESVAAVRVVQSYNMQEVVMARYKDMMQEAAKKVLRRALIMGFSAAFAAFMMFAAYSLVIYFGGYEIYHGWISFEDMLQSFMAILFAAMGMAQAAAGFGDIGKAKGAVTRIFPIVDRVPLIDVHSEEGIQSAELRGEISFRNVDFVYPSRPSVLIFKNFSMEIPAGKTMALVGESGSGKSTVVGMIERFYDCLRGEVLLDGVNIQNYNLRWLRRNVGLVSQEPLLFNGTVADNIRFGAADATLEEIVAAADAANARAFIERLPEQYNTKVGEGGIQLSGGQKQRIAIARAVLKNPKVLLLDEATSALDARSESLVQVALDRIMVGRTSVVIAHRLTTVRKADCISVVFRGVVLEQGNHDELMAKADGAYAKLVAAQNQEH